MTHQIKEWGLFGGIVGLATPVVLKLLSMIPMFQVTFSTIAVNVRSAVTGVGAGAGGVLGNYLKGIAGIELTIPTFVAAAVGGAILAMIAYLVLEKAGYKPRDTKMGAVAVLALAALLQSFVVSGFALPSVWTLVSYVINGVVLAYVVDFVYDQIGFKTPSIA